MEKSLAPPNREIPTFFPFKSSGFELRVRNNLEYEGIERRRQPGEIRSRHIRIDIGHSPTGDKMQLTGEGRLNGSRAHRDKKRLDIQTLFTGQIQFFHDVKRIKLDTDGSISGADFGQALCPCRIAGNHDNQRETNRKVLKAHHRFFCPSLPSTSHFSCSLLNLDFESSRNRRRKL